jgi:hypothetical protein
MKGEITTEKKTFEPIEVNMTLESKSELKRFHKMVGESSGCMDFYDALGELRED